MKGYAYPQISHKVSPSIIGAVFETESCSDFREWPYYEDHEKYFIVKRNVLLRNMKTIQFFILLQGALR